MQKEKKNISLSIQNKPGWNCRYMCIYEKYALTSALPGKEENAMRSAIRGWAVFLLGLFLVLPAFSQIYKWRDRDGNLIVSTTPPPQGTEAEVRDIAGQADTMETESPESMELDPDLRTLKPYSNVKVTLYTTDWCPVCKRARDYLNELCVDLTEYDVEKDPERDRERLEKTNGKTGVPVIDIEGIVIVGFSKASVKKAVENKRIL